MVPELGRWGSLGLLPTAGLLVCEGVPSACTVLGLVAGSGGFATLPWIAIVYLGLVLEALGGSLRGAVSVLGVLGGSLREAVSVFGVLGGSLREAVSVFGALGGSLQEAVSVLGVLRGSLHNTFSCLEL